MVSPPKACSSPAKAPLCLPPWWRRRALLPRLGEGALDEGGHVDPLLASQPWVFSASLLTASAWSYRAGLKGPSGEATWGCVP